MKLDTKVQKEIASAFQKMKTTDDFVELINQVNNAVHTSTNPLKIQHLNYHAFHNEKKYKTFTIPKKTGGSREITAPSKALKHVQTPINIILQCVYSPSKVAHGFVQNRSVVSNAKNHVGKNYVFNIDLENFFPSIHKARIEKRLQLPPFNLNGQKSEIATMISRLTTKKVVETSNEGQAERKYAVLPQGAPTSPVISNAICEKLDRRLLGLAKRFNAKYTRYADDITFSSMHNIYQDNGEFLQELERIIKDQNFSINTKKTRLQKKGYKQEVTGVIVNEKTNVPKKYIKQLRAMLYAIEKHGKKKAVKSFRKHYQDEKGCSEQEIPQMMDVLHGKLQYLKMVKGSDDATFTKLNSRYEAIVQKKAKKSSSKNVTQTMNHNPKKLVELLSVFTQNNNTLKYITHSWDMGQQEEKWENFDHFLEEVEKEWNKIAHEIIAIKRQLSAKIYNFIFQKELGSTDSDGRDIYWGMHKIKFGWSSPELKEWCDEGNNPFLYLLPKDKRIPKDKSFNSIDRFKDVVELFKNEIEIKDDKKQLKKLLRDLKKEYLGNEFSVKIDPSIDGVTFYTDVQHLRYGLAKIFEEIAKRTEYPEIKIVAEKNIDDGYIDIKIIHLGSSSNKMSKELLDTIKTGDFADIKKFFTSLCDWSVVVNCEDGSYKIDYLNMYSTDVEIHQYNEDIDGFTHILRFYR